MDISAHAYEFDWDVCLVLVLSCLDFVEWSRIRVCSGFMLRNMSTIAVKGALDTWSDEALLGTGCLQALRGSRSMRENLLESWHLRGLLSRAVVELVKHQASQGLEVFLCHWAGATAAIQADAALWAAALGDARCMELLVKAGATHRRSPRASASLNSVALRGDLRGVLWHLAEGLESHLALATALHVAADGQITEALLLAKAPATSNDACAASPLHDAAWRGAASVCSTLLQFRAQVDARDELGETPLMHAANRLQAEACRCLLSARANKIAQDLQGNTALDFARHYDMSVAVLGDDDTSTPRTRRKRDWSNQSLILTMLMPGEDIMAEISPRVL